MVAAKPVIGKTSKNTVGVQPKIPDESKMIRMSLPREISRTAYGIEQKFIFPGLPATALNLKLMKAKADTISVDIATGNFDVTWEKYQLGVVAANKLTSIDGGKKPEMGLLELWEKFKEYKRPSLAETTFINKWEKRYTKIFVDAIGATDGTSTEIRNYIISNTNLPDAKSALSSLESAYQWGIQHELVIKNPFLGMAKEMPVKKKVKEDDSFDEDEDTRAFTLDEMNVIIEYFENTSKISHWANYVKFLFYTGCRPGEAAALRWKHISPDCKIIKFSQSYDITSGITKSTKTDTIRIFPCHDKLQQLLLEMKKNSTNNDSLIFLSKNNRQINKINFGRLWRGHPNGGYKGVIPVLLEQKRVKQYLKPYATRHTFITAQVNGGVDAHVIAGWVGNSADIIWKHYYQHKQNQKPVNM